MLSIFSCTFWPSVCVLWKNVYLNLLPVFWLRCLFFFWRRAAWPVCIFWRLISSVTLLANIFSHSVACLFVLFMVSFAMQKLLSLIRSHLFIFVFIFITLGGGLKKILLQFMSKSVLPMFFSEFYSVQPYIYVFHPFWVYFCVWCGRMF